LQSARDQNVIYGFAMEPAAPPVVPPPPPDGLIVGLFGLGGGGGAFCISGLSTTDESPPPEHPTREMPPKTMLRQQRQIRFNFIFFLPEKKASPARKRLQARELSLLS